MKEVRKAKGIQSKTLDEEPALYADLTWLWNGFEFLSQTRQYGMGGAFRISPHDMKAWLDMRGIRREDDIDFALRMIPRMDIMWLDDHYKEAEQRRSKASSKKR